MALSLDSWDSEVPPTQEMLAEDIFIRYLNQVKTPFFDILLPLYACGQSSEASIHGLFDMSPGYFNWQMDGHDSADYRDFMAIVATGLCPYTVYSGMHEVARLKEASIRKFAHWETLGYNDISTIVVNGGLTRFAFGSSPFPYIVVLGTHLQTLVGIAWLFQAQSVLAAHHGALQLEDCYIVNPRIMLQIGLPDSMPTQYGTPIPYLFIQPPPKRLADFDSWIRGQIYFWSFDEDGATQITELECKHIGLPGVALIKAAFSLNYWHGHIYDAIHKWQVARGFDPTTTDYTHSVPLPILETIVQQDNQFEEAGGTFSPDLKQPQTTQERQRHSQSQSSQQAGPIKLHKKETLTVMFM
ncbi:hypothetical protein Moror_7879 [Moniliophthora roreri MCA 2997]|uniref:Uncharacterized protein n=1 Tax=Moniliophthora roreri (strain MCA 2997) TaxID=1381753 RepID=V2X8H7_MONRO|nr:hypothetical protein Moror_7879 [Moniliophthora roreri MCA 2997]